MTYARQIEEAAQFIARRTRVPSIDVAVILGTGLGSAIEPDDPATLAYGDIPHFVAPSVEGNRGTLSVGALRGLRVAVFHGRFHYYEGLSMRQVALGVYVAAALHARALIATNAAGALAAELAPGDLMIVRDHINLMGDSPLRGPNDPRLGTRFPSMADAYDPLLRAAALGAAHRAGLRAREGVYAALPGPAYETGAELRMLRALGADAVGMSTVPEVLAARHAGMRACALSVIANATPVSADAAPDVSHEDVQRVVASAADGVRLAIEELLDALR